MVNKIIYWISVLVICIAILFVTFMVIVLNNLSKGGVSGVLIASFGLVVLAIILYFLSNFSKKDSVSLNSHSKNVEKSTIVVTALAILVVVIIYFSVTVRPQNFPKNIPIPTNISNYNAK